MVQTNSFYFIATNANKQAHKVLQDFNMGSFSSRAVANHKTDSYESSDTVDRSVTAVDIINAVASGLSALAGAGSSNKTDAAGGNNKKLDELNKELKDVNTKIKDIDDNYVTPGKFEQNHYEDLNTKIAECDENMAGCDAEINDYDNKIADCDARIKAVGDEAAIDAKLMEYDQKLAEFDLQNEELIAESVCVADELVRTGEEYKASVTAYNETSCIPADKDSKWATFKTVQKTVTKTVNGEEIQETVSEKVFDQEATNEKKKAEMDQLKADLDLKNTARMDALAHKRDLDEQNQQLQSERTEITAAYQDFLEAKSQINTIREEQQGYETQKAACQAKKAEYQTEKEGYQAELSNLDSKKAEYEDLKKRKKDLEKQIKDLGGTVQEETPPTPVPVPADTAPAES